MRETHPPEQLHRLPGMFHRTELGSVVGPGIEFLIEEAGHDCYGLELFIIYRREPFAYLTEVLADAAGTPGS